MIGKNLTKLAGIFSTVALAGLAFQAQADSQRLQWNQNQHFYQRFDQPVTWSVAQKKCGGLGAHLVTVTSDAEQGFIDGEWGGNSSTAPTGYYWIGASDAKKEGSFQWVTGEKWSYTQWYSLGGSDYVAHDLRYTNGWFTRDASYTYGYICEWSADNYIDTVVVPDLNNNGVDEIAALYVDYVTGSHTVKVRDPQSGTILNTLTFKKSFVPPQGMVVLNDLNGNDVPEIGVLYVEFNQPTVGIKDALAKKGGFLQTLRFLKGYRPIAVNSAPQSNPSRPGEITVLGVHKKTNKPKAETRNSKTGSLINSVSF